MPPVNTLALVARSVSRKITAAAVLEELRRGADGLDAVDEAGWTALHYACFMGHDLLVAELLKGGADHQRRSAANHAPSALAYKKGSTPSDVAKRQQAKSVRLAWRTLALLEAHEQGPASLAKEIAWQQSALAAQQCGWARVAVPPPAGRSPIRRESFGIGGGGGAEPKMERRWYALRECRLSAYREPPADSGSPSGGDRGRLVEIDTWSIAALRWLVDEGEPAAIQVEFVEQAAESKPLTFHFDDDEAATLAWLNALVAACPRATRPEDVSPSPRLSRLPPPGFFMVTPESADQVGSVPPTVAADGVVTWEVSEDPEAFAVATSRDGASAAGLSRFDSAPFALRDRWWQLRLTVDAPANTCGVHLLAAGVPERGERRQDEAGEQGNGEGQEEEEEEEEEQVCASFTLKLEAPPALRGGNVALHRSDRRPFQPGVGWGQLEMCAGPAPPITRFLDTKPPEAALRCVHRCSLSELEAARTLQVILCDFITSHLD
eukprot:COSAG04_NODE_58_length_30339_cov_51.748578_21_plen_492_part_01